ncbi:MAG: hypothetical protein ACQEQ4_10045 [Fibrobacterota bacterium]
MKQQTGTILYHLFILIPLILGGSFAYAHGYPIIPVRILFVHFSGVFFHLLWYYFQHWFYEREYSHPRYGSGSDTGTRYFFYSLSMTGLILIYWGGVVWGRELTGVFMLLITTLVWVYYFPPVTIIRRGGGEFVHMFFSGGLLPFFAYYIYTGGVSDFPFDLFPSVYFLVLGSVLSIEMIPENRIFEDFPHSLPRLWGQQIPVHITIFYAGSLYFLYTAAIFPGGCCGYISLIHTILFGMLMISAAWAYRRPDNVFVWRVFLILSLGLSGGTVGTVFIWSVSAGME